MVYRRLLTMLVPSPIKNSLNNIHIRLAEAEVSAGHLQIAVTNLETVVDCWIESPKYVPSDKAGFNGQAARKQIFRDLISTFDFQQIFETGTWTGDTTAYMAETSKLPVSSTELSHRFHALAKIRLADFERITLENLDSRRFIEKLIKDSNLTSARSFFYLDAHWYDDLPLKEEVDLIAQHWDQSVIMVDDFQVSWR
ncbi:MAG: hypothetical protein M3463_12190 [Verrucomicrobiota bacterium]|nr:hypothetical protein [Verrucomicrobiota bacterium]